MSEQPNKRPHEDFHQASIKRAKHSTTSTPHHSSHSHSAEQTEQARVAHHYNARGDAGIAIRQQSPILRMKNFNNWMKSVIIAEYIERRRKETKNAAGLIVLDICCGKGGDLKKFQKANVAYYVGADHADKSVEAAVSRYNIMVDKSSRYRHNNEPMFPAKFIVADCHKHLLSSCLPPTLRFDFVSCQFALHYSFESESRARIFMQNVAERLCDGGYFVATFPNANVLVRNLSKHLDTCEFGNSIHTIRFPPHHSGEFSASQPFGHKYWFTLQDAIDDCPEYLVPLHTLQHLAAEYGMEMIFAQNLHQFFLTYGDREKFPQYHDLLRIINVMSDGGISQDEWEAIYVYMAVAFRKTSTPLLPISSISPSENKSAAISSLSTATSSSDSDSSSSSSSTRSASSSSSLSSSSSSSSSSFGPARRVNVSEIVRLDLER